MELSKTQLDLLKSLRSEVINRQAELIQIESETAEKLIELGFLISFSGNLTFKNSKLPEVASRIPLSSLLVETDSPYLSPVPFRGKPNEPARARYVAEKLADIHNCSVEKIANKTSENALKLFKFS